jgi:dipeptidyl aminopeptidase/acylaminoacyl peptidase
MQDDVTDAVRHMIDAGVADPARICIVGASYGGYVALAGAALTPDLYRCAISIAGVSDLAESVNRVGTVGSMTRHYWLRSIGDPSENRAALDAVSPRHLADRIRAPVLLIHGEEDDTVEIRQSELMQQALGSRSRLIRLADEGHYWDDWSREHRLTVFRETEAFLAQHNPAQ